MSAYRCFWSSYVFFSWLFNYVNWISYFTLESKMLLNTHTPVSCKKSLKNMLLSCLWKLNAYVRDFFPTFFVVKKMFKVSYSLNLFHWWLLLFFFCKLLEIPWYKNFRKFLFDALRIFCFDKIHFFYRFSWFMKNTGRMWWTY